MRDYYMNIVFTLEYIQTILILRNIHFRKPQEKSSNKLNDRLFYFLCVWNWFDFIVFEMMWKYRIVLMQ